MVAAEIEQNADPAGVIRLVAPVVRAQVSYFQLIILPVFPRTETGKVRREAVNDLYRRRAESL